MKNSKPIRIFEHKQLLIKDGVFTRKHWEALGWYNERYGAKFFTLTPNGVKFNHYVGVIQVGNLTIEVLPKIGQESQNGDETRWQGVLIDMLRECRWMQLHANEKAALRFKPNSILEAYLEIFVSRCEELVRIGLIKKYRNVDANVFVLKGKLLFNQHMQHNLIHKERFYTRHQIYDRENIYNQILLKALRLLPQFSQSPYLKDRVFSLLLLFPELEDVKVSASTFEKLKFNRKTAHYQDAIEIAAMLLLNYRPDISSGPNHILAILFNMNELWEEYIFRKLHQSKPTEWSIESQKQKQFWLMTDSNTTKSIKPDMVIKRLSTNEAIVIDTKWKLPDNNVPADSDLKQMYVYNEYWHGKKALLLYPQADFIEEPAYIDGNYKKKSSQIEAHGCGIVKVSVLDKSNQLLDKTIGKRINKFLKKELLK